MRKGFTIVEILVVVGVLTVTSVIFVEIFFRSLKGGNQAQTLGVIKQNGQQAIELMDKNIRLADNVVCVGAIGGGTDNTLVIEKEKNYTRFRFISPTSTKNGYISQDNIDNCSAPSPSDSLMILTNTDSISGVSVLSGSFQKDTKAGFKDVILINFTIGPGVGVPKSLTNNIDPLEFTTSVELR